MEPFSFLFESTILSSRSSPLDPNHSRSSVTSIRCDFLKKCSVIIHDIRLISLQSHCRYSRISSMGCTRFSRRCQLSKLLIMHWSKKLSSIMVRLIWSDKNRIHLNLITVYPGSYPWLLRWRLCGQTKVARTRGDFQLLQEWSAPFRDSWFNSDPINRWCD